MVLLGLKRGLKCQTFCSGNWDSTAGVDEEDKQDAMSKLESKALDEDADVDEAEDWDAEAVEVRVLHLNIDLCDL